MKAITTTFDGIEYRSRLEARWAAYFAGIGWQFTYEPFDGNGYIPDFLIHGDRPMLVEVKPAVTEADYLAPIPKIEAGLAGHWNHDILIVGASPLPTRFDTVYGGIDGSPDRPLAGILGEAFTSCGTCNGRWVAGHDDCVGDEVVWDFSAAIWHECGKCFRESVHHSIQSFASRPCAHYDGGNHLHSFQDWKIKNLWAEATNAVKWRGASAARA